MTGWRMGWTIGPAAVVKAMDTIQSQETSCPSSVSQAALDRGAGRAAGLRGRDAEGVRGADGTRPGSCSARFPASSCRSPDGAFYAFFDVSAYFGKRFGGKPVTDSLAFCNALLEQAHVNLVPGSAFGAEGFVRMSFATSRERDRGPGWRS